MFEFTNTNSCVLSILFESLVVYTSRYYSKFETPKYMVEITIGG
jgi:hypothetical protein